MFVLSAIPQLAASYGANSLVAHQSPPGSGSTVTSGGAEEPYIIQQVASASNPNQVFQITGAQVAQRLIGGAFKNYLYLFVNTGKTFPVNTTGITSQVSQSGYNTNNIYWNVQTPPTNGGTMEYATVGQDVDLGATSNTLSEWQWSNMNYVFGGRVSPISYTGSYDGGGPTACHVYSNGQMRHSVYVMIVDSNSHAAYTITGGVLIEQSINGVLSTTFIALVSGSQGRVSTTGDNVDCPQVSNPISSPSMRWYVRTPPTSGVSPTGNFGITGTVGAGLAKAQTTNAIMLLQFVDRTFQTGFIPNQACATCVSVASSTDPVSGGSAIWPGK